MLISQIHFCIHTARRNHHCLSAIVIAIRIKVLQNQTIFRITNDITTSLLARPLTTPKILLAIPLQSAIKRPSDRDTSELIQVLLGQTKLVIVKASGSGMVAKPVREKVSRI